MIASRKGVDRQARMIFGYDNGARRTQHHVRREDADDRHYFRHKARTRSTVTLRAFRVLVDHASGRRRRFEFEPRARTSF